MRTFLCFKKWFTKVQLKKNIVSVRTASSESVARTYIKNVDIYSFSVLLTPAVPISMDILIIKLDFFALPLTLKRADAIIYKKRRR